jgi:hypothetical protein
MLWRKVPARCREDCEGLLLTRFMVNALTEFDGSASNTTFTTSDSVLQIEHSVARFQPKPSQECRSQQRRVSAGDAIDLDEIPRPEILDAGRIHLEPSERTYLSATIKDCDNNVSCRSPRLSLCSANSALMSRP